MFGSLLQDDASNPSSTPQYLLINPLVLSKLFFPRTIVVSNYRGIAIAEMDTQFQNEPFGTAMEIDTENEEKLVCFGMLPDLIAQFVRTRGQPIGSHIKAALEIEEEHIPLNIWLDDTSCGISTLTGKLIGVLNNKSSVTLAKLHEIGQVRYLCFVQRANLRNGMEELQKGPDKIRFCVDITVLGPESLGDQVARKLRDGRLYLQQPYSVPEPYEYKNPQYLDIQYSPDDVFAAEPILDNHPENTAVGNTLDQPMTAMEVLLATLNSLTQSAGLTQARVDDQVTTKLLAHQREALDFIIARENGDTTKYSGLWSKNSLQEDQIYQHKIAGSKRPSPEDISGGILADEMGLCKTLSMISAIVATSRKAKGFQESTKPEGSSKCVVSSTLVIVPSYLLVEGWLDEIQKHVKAGALSYYIYHGPGRKLDLSKSLPDIVLTTYGTVASECGRTSAGSVLRQVHWYRIILDEAHIIRNWSTKQFRAIDNLSAEIRWCVTGTPVQNGVDDIGALIRFLRLPILSEPSNFRKHISSKMGKVGGGLSPSDYTNLRLVLSSICLRRTTTVLDLPGVEEFHHRPCFKPEEREAYNGLIRDCIRVMDRSIFGDPNHNVTWHRKNTTSKPSSNAILASLLRLRLFCNQGFSIGPDNGFIPSSPDEALSLLYQRGVSSCRDCGADLMAAQDDTKPAYGYHLTACHVILCNECVSKFLDDLKHAESEGRTRVCPFCSGTDSGVNLLLPRETIFSAETISYTACPSKIEALVSDLSKTAGEAKSIVFSFWLKSLDLVEKLLKERNITFRRVDGSCPKSDKKVSLQDFKTKPEVSVLLMTFGTGSMGLNDLNVANRVHILEPQWNPSVENQAIGRVSRVGQTKKVTVIRYVMQKSIEELVENRQVLKIMLAVGGGLGAGKGPLNSEAQRSATDLRQHLSQLLC